MKAMAVMDQAAGRAGAKLLERPEPQAAINDALVQVHASGFTGDDFSAQRQQHQEDIANAAALRHKIILVLHSGKLKS